MTASLQDDAISHGFEKEFSQDSLFYNDDIQ